MRANNKASSCYWKHVSLFRKKDIALGNSLYLGLIMQNDIFTAPIVGLLEKEHQNMFERTRSLDTRASILISAITAIMPLYFSVFNWSEFKKSFCGHLSFIKAIEISCFVISIGALCVCFVKCFSTVSSKKYMAPNVNIFNGFNLKEYEEVQANSNQINTILIKLYVASIEHNDTVIQEKAGMFRASIRALQVFLFASIIGIILTNF